jgi:uncharacterized protein (TIGR01319 family)
MKPVLLIDFGSTYTKVTAADITECRILGTAVSHTTVETDIGDGLDSALVQLENQIGVIDYKKQLACSSAAGGLRMVACGLVPKLTAEAAKLAALGAGAKLAGLYSYELTEDDADEIEAISPDIFLLTGGTDGGNKDCILKNAEILASLKANFPIIVAGNRNCGRQVMKILGNKSAFLVENVMPTVDKLNIEPTRAKIRDIFLERIIQAKGLSKISKLVTGILMPTPAAVLAAMELLSKGCDDESGLGELMAVDVGGATTDVYSISDGFATGFEVVYKGLPEPFAKRTVEGDIGMRYSVDGIVELAGLSRVASLAGLDESIIKNYVDSLKDKVEHLPQDKEEQAIDFALAALAIEIAVQRHAGTIEEVYTTSGKAFIQTGKNLSDANGIVMTGGALIHAERQSDLAPFAMYSENQPQSLRPKNPQVMVDKKYILAAMGLLGGFYPTAALRIMKAELQKI